MWPKPAPRWNVPGAERSVPNSALTSGKQRGDHAEKVKQLKSEAAPAAGPPVSGVTSMEDPPQWLGAVGLFSWKMDLDDLD